MRNKARRLAPILSGIAAVAMTAIAGTAAFAETKTVNLAQQFGLLYLPQHVVFEYKLIQKHAKRLGIPEPEVKLFKISGGANVNKALLAKEVDFGALGIGPGLKLWGKSNGEFRAATTLTDMPLKLVTNDPSVKRIEDYLNVADHKIATPAAKVSIQAVVLQMAAERIWGKGNAEKLDSLVVSMNHPTSVAALLSGGQAVKSHFATLPYSFTELRDPKIHMVASSYDILGGEHTTIVLLNSKEFKDANPKTYQAVVAAHQEAFGWIAANKEAAAGLFIRYEQSKVEPSEILAMINDSKEINYSKVPKKTMEIANFLASIGDIPQPKSWKDYFWENNHNENGS
jgi:NitT/TauT family transport system substrate-binding protein